MNLLNPATPSTPTTTTKLACNSRYRAPTVRNLLSYTLFFCHQIHSPNHHNHRLLLQRSLLAPKISTFSVGPQFPIINFLTGNSPFFRMEVSFCRVVIIIWTFYSLLLLITTNGLPCSHFNPSHFYNTCPRTSNQQTWPITATSIDSSKVNERFWGGNGLGKNKAMVEQLKRYGMISSDKVAEVMETIDRALFVPDGNPPYYDSPMAIGYNATISAPHMHATCLQLLEDNLQPGMCALDVGSGTGYLTACFAQMVGPEGRAVGVEHIPELVAFSIENIQKSAAAPLLKEGSLSVNVGDGRLGWPEFAPYDAIHVGAAAPEIPQPLIDQLKPGGRMVIPVGNIFQDLKVVDKNLDGSVSVRSETSVRYVPLTSRDAQLQG